MFRDVRFHEEFSPFKAMPNSQPIPDLFFDIVLPLPQPDVDPLLPTEPEPIQLPVEPDVPSCPPTSAMELRRASRVSRPPSYLQQYLCHNVTD